MRFSGKKPTEPGLYWVQQFDDANRDYRQCPAWVCRSALVCMCGSPDCKYKLKDSVETFIVTIVENDGQVERTRLEDCLPSVKWSDKIPLPENAILVKDPIAN